MTWATLVLFALMIRGEPLFLRSLPCPMEERGTWLIREFQRTTDYVKHLFPELRHRGVYVGGSGAKETLAALATQEKATLLKVEDCWDAELSGFGADLWLDALGLALRP